MFGKLLNWMRVPVARVPDDVAVCEFDCHKQECLLHDWEHCERRLRAGKPQGRSQHRPSC